jgi:hypothetical protein
MISSPMMKAGVPDRPSLSPRPTFSCSAAWMSGAKQQIKGDKLFDYHIRLLESRGRVNGERAIAVAKDSASGRP